MDAIDFNSFMLLSLVFTRVFGFIIFNPVFGRMSVPNIVKMSMALAMTLVLYPQVLDTGINIAATGSLGYALLLLKEFAIGYVIGFIMRLYEFVVVYAGGIIDYEMGLSMSAIYDMQHGQQIPLSGNLIQVFYYLIFFAVDGHLAVVKIFYDFSAINAYGSISLGPNLMHAILDLFLSCVVLAVRFAMPVVVLQLLTEMAEGILMKVLPSINVFVVNLQMKIIIGMLILYFLTSPIFQYLNNLVLGLSEDMMRVLKIMTG